MANLRSTPTPPERTGPWPTLPVLMSRYEVHGLLARGGMATVHFGCLRGDLGFRRVVAVKRLHPEHAADPDFVLMLRDEARIAARVRHPNVAALLDIVHQDGVVLLVFDYVHGASLSALLVAARRAGRPVPVRVACAIVADVLRGLAAAHAAVAVDGSPLGVVHRDVAPPNVLIGLDGITRVADFGIASAAGRAYRTRPGELRGRLAFMSPECLHGGSATQAVDVYSVAAVLGELLAGRPVFLGDTDAMTIVNVLNGVAPDFLADVPGVPSALRDVVLRGMARAPEARFANAEAMTRAIAAATQVASPAEVAEWVRGLMGYEIELRGRIAAHIERGPDETPREAEVPVAETSAPPVAVAPRDVETGPAEARVPVGSRGAVTTITSRRRRTRAALAAALLALCVAVPLAAVAIFRASPAQDARAAGASVAPPPPRRGDVANDAAAVAPKPETTASSVVAKAAPAPSASPAVVAPTPAAPPSASASPRDRRKNAPRAPVRAPRPGCARPYVVDASGRTHFRRECL